LPPGVAIGVDVQTSFRKAVYLVSSFKERNRNASCGKSK
jgi:hypothetical protein